MAVRAAPDMIVVRAMIVPLTPALPQGDSDFLWAEAHEKSYVPQVGEGVY
jgi:hypothetical protein